MELGVSTRSLREDLLAIDGVEGAEIDGDPSTPSGLRVRVSQHADQKLVGESIRQVLSEHGFGTDTPLPGDPPTSVTESAHDQVVTSVSHHGTEPMATPEPPAPVATLVSAPPDGGHLQRVPETADEPPMDDEPEPARVIDLTMPELEDEFATDHLAHPAHGTSTRTTIDRVSVEEARHGVVVTVVASDGEFETEVARASEGGVEQAVILATARLATPGGPVPIVIEIEDRRIEGTDIVMIVLDHNGDIRTGSAVVGAGRAFAIGRATWSAMLM